MHHHAGRFVNDHQARVLIDDVQRDVLGDNLALIAGTVHDHADHVAGMHAVVALDRAATHADALGLGRILHAVAAGALDALYQILIDAQQHLSWLHHIVVVLPVVAPVLGEVGLTIVILNLVAACFQTLVKQFVVQRHDASVFLFVLVRLFVLVLFLVLVFVRFLVLVFSLLGSLLFAFLLGAGLGLLQFLLIGLLGILVVGLVD